MALMSSWVTTGGVAALVVADVVLVTLAVLHVRGDDGAAATGSSGTSSEPSAEPSPDQSVDPSGPRGDERPDEHQLDAGPVLLDVAVDGTILRSSRGQCGGDAESSPVQPVVEVSTDGGRSFAPVDLDDAVAEVLRVSVAGANIMSVVAADAACAVTTLGSTDGGATWKSSPGTAGAWHLAADAATRVHAPTGSVPTGCRVLALSPVDESGARVLCADGQVRGTSNGGFEWVSLGSLDGAVDIAYAGPAEAWALATTVDCAAAVLRTGDGGLYWQQTGCVDRASEPQAIGAAGGLVAVQAGGKLRTSNDGGETFAEP